MTHYTKFIGNPRQRGAVLFLAMIFLVLLSILAITASSSSIMQERMTGGMRNRQLGLMGAESGLRGSEEFMWNLNFNQAQHPLPPCIDNSTGVACLYQPQPSGLLAPAVQAFRTDRNWIPAANDGANAYARSLVALSGSSITANIASQPRYIIEILGMNVPPSAGKTDGVRYRQGGEARVGEHYLYRMTSRSQGGTDAVVRITESYYSAINFSTTGFNPP